MKKTFNQKCYELLKKVPKGKVTTYKELARALNTKAYRAVGNAMNKNHKSFPNGGNIPCHRVVNSNGKLGGFAHGIKAKIKLLKSEGIEINSNNQTIELKKYFYRLKK